MKHSKHIARIVAFALLAVTMIGSFIGCKNAAGGDGSEDLTGFTKSTLQIYEVTESGGKVSLYEKRLGKRADSQDASSWNLQSIPYTAKGGYSLSLQQVFISCMKTNLIPVVMMPTVLPYRVSLLGLKKIP